jgi:hypothetical protein
MGTAFSEFFCCIKKRKKVSPGTRWVDENMYARDHNSIDWINVPVDYPPHIQGTTV